MHDISPDEFGYALFSQEIYLNGVGVTMNSTLFLDRLFLPLLNSLAFWTLGNPSLLIAKGVSVFFDILTIPLTYLFGRVVFTGKRARTISIIASILLAFNYGFWLNADRVWSDVAAAFFTILFFFFIASSLRNQETSIKFQALSGVIWGILLLTKLSVAILILPAVGVLLLLHYYEERKIRDFVLRVGLLFGPTSFLILIMTLIDSSFVGALTTLFFKYANAISYVFNPYLLQHSHGQTLYTCTWRWLTVFLQEPDIQGLMVILAFLGMLGSSVEKKFRGLFVVILTWILAFGVLAAWGEEPTYGVSGIRHFFPVLPIFCLFASDALTGDMRKRRLIYILLGLAAYILFAVLEPFDYFEWVINPLTLSILIIYIIFGFLLQKGLVLKASFRPSKKSFELHFLLRKVLLFITVCLLVSPGIINTFAAYVSQPSWLSWYEAEGWLSSHIQKDDVILALMPGRWRAFSHAGLSAVTKDIEWIYRDPSNPWQLITYYPSYMLEQNFLRENNVSYVAVTRQMFRSIDRAYAQHVGETTWEEILSKKYLTRVFEVKNDRETVLAVFRYEPLELHVEPVVLNPEWNVSEGSFEIRDSQIYSTYAGYNKMWLKDCVLDFNSSVTYEVTMDLTLLNASEMNILLANKTVFTEVRVKFVYTGRVGIYDGFGNVLKQVKGLDFDPRAGYTLRVELVDRKILVVSVYSKATGESTTSFGTELKEELESAIVGVWVYGCGCVGNFTIYQKYWTKP